jgi:two-component system, cell cycle sensor histidine kinase PleC
VRVINRGATAPSGAASKPSAPQPQKEVQAARTRLSQSAHDKPDFDAELMQLFVRNEMHALPTIPLLAVVFALASMFWAPMAHAAVWLCGVIIAKLVLISVGRSFEDPSASLHSMDYWKRRFVGAELLSGLAWAGLAFVGASVADASSQVFILVSLIVLIAVRMTYASSVMSIFYAGTIPMTVAVAGRLLMQNHPFYFAMATMQGCMSTSSSWRSG